MCRCVPTEMMVYYIQKTVRMNYLVYVCICECLCAEMPVFILEHTDNNTKIDIKSYTYWFISSRCHCVLHRRMIERVECWYLNTWLTHYSCRRSLFILIPIDRLVDGWIFIEWKKEMYVLALKNSRYCFFFRFSFLFSVFECLPVNFVWWDACLCIYIDICLIWTTKEKIRLNISLLHFSLSSFSESFQSYTSHKIKINQWPVHQFNTFNKQFCVCV